MRIRNIIIMLVTVLLITAKPTTSSAYVIDNSFSTITSALEDVLDVFKEFNAPTPDKSIKKNKKKKDNDDDGYYDDDDDDGNDIPLDGGLSFLAIAGAGLGLKKVIEYRNKK